MVNNSKVSILVLTFNSSDCIGKCLMALVGAVSPEVEIIVIDNNSTDRTIQLVNTFGERIRTIKNSQNYGYSRGNNLGLEVVKRPYVLILNPDVEVTPFFLDPLVTTMEEDQNIAAVQPLVLLNKDKSLINLSGKQLHYLGFEWCKNYLRKRSTVKVEKEELLAFSGSCVLLRHQAIKETGPFEEEYFMYGEDSDLSWRLRAASYKLILEPESVVYHDYYFLTDKKSMSLKDKFYLVERNRLFNLLTNYETGTIIILLPAILLTELGLIIFSLSKGLLKSKVSGYFFITRNLGYLLSKRKRNKKLKKLSDRDLLRETESIISYPEISSTGLSFFNYFWYLYWFLVKRFI